MVMQLPEKDQLSMSLEQMKSRLAIMMGGRVAEELIFGKEKGHLWRLVGYRTSYKIGSRDGDPMGA